MFYLLSTSILCCEVEKKRAEAKASSGWFGWFTFSVVEEEKNDVIPSGEAYSSTVCICRVYLWGFQGFCMPQKIWLAIGATINHPGIYKFMKQQTTVYVF